MITQIVNAQSGLLQHYTAYCLLCSLPRFHETGKTTVHRRAKPRRTSQQCTLAATHQHDDTGGDTRILGIVTLGTDHGEIAKMWHGGRATAAAVTMIAIPG